MSAPCLLLALFMLRALHAPIAKLQKFYLPLNLLLILLAPVIDALALLACKFDKPFL